MEISFANRRLQTTCESHRALQSAHGKPCAKKIARRFADLEAASTLEEVRNLPGRCHELDGRRDGQLALSLSDGKRLVFEPTFNPAPKKTDGGLDWTRVEAIRILEIHDYHD